MSAIPCVAEEQLSRRKEKRPWLSKKACPLRHTLKSSSMIMPNQHNPNNKAYQARIANEKKAKKSTRKQEAKRQAALFDELGLNADLDWMCYSNPYDFD